MKGWAAVACVGVLMSAVYHVIVVKPLLKAARERTLENDAEDPASRIRRYSSERTLSGSKAFGAPIATLTVDTETGMVYVSGLVVEDIVPMPPNVKGDAEKEARAVLTAIEELLNSVGAEMDDVVSCLVHVANLNTDLEKVNRAFAEWYTPATGVSRTAVEVGNVILDCRVEITMSARIRAPPPALPGGGALDTAAAAAARGDAPIQRSKLKRFTSSSIAFGSPIAVVVVDEQTELVHCSGMLSDDIVPTPEGAKGDVEKETTAVLQAVHDMLAMVGSGMDSVLYALVHVADINKDFDGVNRAWLRFFAADDLPSRTAVRASRIISDSRVEITVTAVRDREAPALPRSGSDLTVAVATKPGTAGTAARAAGSSSIRRYTSPLISFRAPISTVVVDEVSGMVFVAGVVIDNVRRAPPEAKGDAETETRVILAAIDALLNSVDTSLNNILSCVVHVASVEDDFPGLNRGFADFFTAGRGPARTTVEAGDIVRGARVEITVTAVRPSNSPPLPPSGTLQIPSP